MERAGEAKMAVGEVKGFTGTLAGELARVWKESERARALTWWGADVRTGRWHLMRG